MTASLLHPNIYKGEERSSGYIAPNDNQKSDNSPDWRGRIYIKGVGWYWISGWIKTGRTGRMLSLRVEEMTDEHAEKFCVPKGGKPPRPATSSRPALFADEEEPPPPEGEQPEIPF